MKIVNITFASELGIKAMIVLSRSKEPMTTGVVAQKIKGSAAHVSKVLQRLKNGRLLMSIRGPHGGYRINGPANMTAAEVVEAVDGIRINAVRGRKPTRDHYKAMMRRIEQEAISVLDSRSISYLSLS